MRETRRPRQPLGSRVLETRGRSAPARMLRAARWAGLRGGSCLAAASRTRAAILPEFCSLHPSIRGLLTW